jgi:N-acetylneuraminic acid mutarotase
MIKLPILKIESSLKFIIRMYQINKTVKQLFILVSIISFGALSTLLSSCGGSSPTPTVVKPGNWTSIADFGGAGRSGAASFVIDGKAYVGGGFSSSGTRLQDWWQYDAGTNGWTKKADFTGPARSGAVAFTIGGKGYVGTGIDATNARLKDFYEFDPAANSGLGSWKKIKDFTLERSGCIGFTLNDRGFVGGGASLNDIYSDLWEYKPATDTWESKGAFNKKRTNASVMVINNLAYLVGGIGESYIQEVEQYNPTTNVWIQKLALRQKDETGTKIDQPLPRELASSFTIGEFGYLVAGSQNTSLFSDCWQYNPATDRWIQYYAYNNQYGGPSRDAAVGFAIGNFGYLTTGRGSTRLYGTVKFDPIGVPPAN